MKQSKQPNKSRTKTASKTSKASTGKSRASSRKGKGKGNRKISHKIIVIVAVVVVVVFVAIFAGSAAYWKHFYNNIPVLEGAYPIHGVDVSSYQGDVDWKDLHKNGAAFAYVKATEGSSHKDENYRRNKRKAGAAGLRVGAYHFLSYDSPGEEQADNFIKTVGRGSHMMPPAIDVEFYGDYSKAGQHPTPEQMYAVLDPLIDRLEDRYDKAPVIYTNTFIYQNYISGRYDYDIWISDPAVPKKLSDGKEWTFCQYSFSGTVKSTGGDTGNIDLDVFRGDKDTFFTY